jgi:hypothetical protein
MPPRTSSRTAHQRSPTTPRSSTGKEVKVSPIIDFAGYRQSDSMEPKRVTVGSYTRQLATGNARPEVWMAPRSGTYGIP